MGKFLKILEIFFATLATIATLYLICGIVIILISYIFGIEPVHKLPLIFK